MAQQNQQNHLNIPDFYGQGPRTKYSYNDPSCSPENSAGIGSVEMGRGLSNNSISTDNSDSAWSLGSWSSHPVTSPMESWEQIPAYLIKGEHTSYEWEGNVDAMQYPIPGPQGYQSPITQPSSFTETTIDSRPTPTSLSWGKDTPLLQIYNFVVEKGKDPHFQLMDGYDVTPQTPMRVFLDYPRSPKKGAYPCMYPLGCSGKQTVFNRPADLDRHYKNVHSDQKDSFCCDYPKCGRSSEPFTRKDHYRDHLRDYHKEDLGCAKAQKRLGTKQWAAEQTAWLAERRVFLNWWRCARCLVRRQVQSDGWDCPTCKVTCEQDRIDIRMSQSERHKPMDTAEAGGSVAYTANSVATITAAEASNIPGIFECNRCQESPGWTVDERGENWVACPVCTPRQIETSYSAQGYYT